MRKAFRVRVHGMFIIVILCYDDEKRSLRNNETLQHPLDATKIFIISLF